MTASWSIIQPLAATNYCIDPSHEVWTGGGTTSTYWPVNGSPSSYVQGLVDVWRGQSSAYVVATHISDGFYQDITLTNTQTYTISAYVKVYSGTVQIIGADKGGVSNPITANSSGTGWQRLTVTKVAASGGIRFYIISQGAAATFSVDCCQCEDGSVATTYIDGAEPGCWRNGAAYASTSSRDGQSREGGTLVSLSSYLRINSITGAGVMPVNSASLPMGLAGGEIYQRTTNAARRMIFSGNMMGTSLDNLHTLRRELFDLVKSDAVSPPQPFKMRYNDGVSANSVDIKCVYEGGLDGVWDLTTFYNKANVEKGVQLRVVAFDPLFYADKNEAQSLGYTQTVTNANYILMRGKGSDSTQAGVWQHMGTGMNNVVNCLAWGPDGCLYAGGSFTTGNGVTINGIGKWNGSTFVAMGATGVAGALASVYAIAIDAAGNIYATGSFTSAGGVGGTYGIAKWDGSAWNALGSGLTGGNRVGQCLTIGLDGALYVGGDFTDQGDANGDFIVKWNGAAWSSLGTGANDVVIALTTGPDGSIYACGVFTLMGGVSNTARIAKWDGSTWNALSTGMNLTTRAIAFDKAGILYAGGSFTTAGTISANYIAKWNGTSWIALSTGTNAQVNHILVNPYNGLIYLSGYFTSAGGVSLIQRMCIWTGSAFLPLDVLLPGTPYVYAMELDTKGNLYIGFSTSGSATSATITATSNSSTKAYQILTMIGITAGQVYQLMNYTTGRAIYFNNLIIQPGETITLDTRPGRVAMSSSWRGPMNNNIIQGSQMDWFLQPGANNISCYMVGGSATIYLGWKNTFNSADGASFAI